MDAQIRVFADERPVLIIVRWRRIGRHAVIRREIHLLGSLQQTLPFVMGRVRAKISTHGWQNLNVRARMRILARARAQRARQLDGATGPEGGGEWEKAEEDHEGGLRPRGEE